MISAIVGHIVSHMFYKPEYIHIIYIVLPKGSADNLWADAAGNCKSARGVGRGKSESNIAKGN